MNYFISIKKIIKFIQRNKESKSLINAIKIKFLENKAKDHLNLESIMFIFLECEHKIIIYFFLFFHIAFSKNNY